MATALEPLTGRHSPAQPPPPRSSRAAATAAWRVPRLAPCSRRPRRPLAHAARARASRRRAPRAAATAPIISITASATALRLCGIGSLMGARLAGSRVLAFGGTQRIRTGAVRLCGSGSAGLAAAHQCTHASLRSKPRIGHQPRDDARAASAAPSTACLAKASRKQTNKQASKQTNKISKQH